MFQSLLEQAKDNITTVRSIIKTNENLRQNLLTKNLAIQNPSQDYLRLIYTLKKDIPKTRSWRIYDHCAAVTKLYAIYENFVEDLIRDWVKLLPELFLDYEDLDERVRNTHQFGVGKLLLDLNKSRYEHLSLETIINGLYSGVKTPSAYQLLPDAFLLHEQNLRKEILEKLLTDAGIVNSWQWLNKHQAMKNFIEEIRGSQNTVEGELNELISYRNDAAHGGEIDNFLNHQTLLELCDFIESICQALVDLLTYKAIEQKAKIGKAQKIGKITEWYPKPQAGVANLENTFLQKNYKLFLVNENIAYCRAVIVRDIQENDISCNEITITETKEIGLKFDVNARKNLDIYIVN